MVASESYLRRYLSWVWLSEFEAALQSVYYRMLLVRFVVSEWRYRVPSVTFAPCYERSLCYA